MKFVRLRGEKISAIIICLFFLLFFVFFQSSSIYGGDAGDLVTAAFTRGIAHPPGYPLYIFLGWMLTYLPISTVAWRVTLLSSIPAAVSLAVLFILIHQLIKRTIPALVAILTLGFSYLYWLYASVPEVFMLHVLLVTFQMYLLFRLTQQKKINYKIFYLFSFTIGLSLSHHHTIAIMFPGYAYLLIKYLKNKTTERNKIVISLLFFLTGLSFYLYAIWAAKSGSPVNWENPQTPAGFIRLFTRAMYGTFKAHNAFPEDLLNRLYQIKLVVDTFIIDFTKLGLVLIGAGLVSLFIKNRKWFWFLIIEIVFSIPVFFSYANFPSTINFHLGTMERFLLVPYVLVAICVGYGVDAISCGIKIIFEKVLKRKTNLQIGLFFLLLPLTLVITNYPRITPLKFDRTAEYLVDDIFLSTPDNSILLLLGDTVFFNSEYTYFTSGGEKEFRNIKLIQIGGISREFYVDSLNALFKGEVYLPQKVDNNIQQMTLEVIKLNYGRFPIFTNFKINLGDEYVWYQHGLLYQALKKDDHLSDEDYKNQNMDLMAHFHDPLAGALAQYKHVMLADVLRVYGNAYSDFGESLIKLKDYSTAENYYTEALRLLPENSSNYSGAIWVYFKQKKCTEAEKLLDTAKTNFPEEITLYEVAIPLYGECFKNAEKAEVYKQEYLKRFNKMQTPLN